MGLVRKPGFLLAEQLISVLKFPFFPSKRGKNGVSDKLRFYNIRDRLPVDSF